MNPIRKAATKSLDDVAAFVQDCGATRMDETAVLFPLNPDDVAAEAKSEGRLIIPRRTNPHD